MMARRGDATDATKIAIHADDAPSARDVLLPYDAKSDAQAASTHRRDLIFSDWRHTLHFIAVASATIISLTVYGVLQERVMTVPYARVQNSDGSFFSFKESALSGTTSSVVDADDPNARGDIFSSSMFLVLMNRWMALVIASVLSLTTHRSGEHEDGRSGLRDYAAVAFSNLVATVCQYEVLKYLTFSVSTLAKTMKVVPVMAWGQFLGEKKYAPRQYLEALLVTFGCFLFVANRGWRSAVQKTYGDQVDDHDMEWAANAGFAILGVYFIFDGFTSSFQQKMFRRDKSTVVSQILYTSFFTTIFAFLWLLFTGQLRASLEFVTVHAAVRGDILILSASSTVAQFAIAYTIYSYSAVILASIMTFRQFLSVLISCYAFGAPLNVLQWLALLLIVAPAMFKHVALPTDVADDKSPGRADRSRTDRPTEYDRL